MSQQCFYSRGTFPCRVKPALPKPAAFRISHQRFRNNSPIGSHHRAAAGRVKHLQVVAFRDATERTAAPTPRSSRIMAVSEHVSVPVDYYRLLQVPRVSRPDAIRKAYEAMMNQAPATAYSADTLFARAVLLKAAAESLSDPDLRRSYDAKLAAGHSALRVSQQDLPGALVVLQEIGEFQLVLDLGTQWLERNGSQPDAGDVAAAVALAYCDRAGERLASAAGQGAVLPACDDLDAALVKLRRYGMAKQLQTQIVGALRDLAPEYACELAALPLGSETTSRRAKGVALMRGVLRSAAASLTRGGVAAGDAAAELLGADLDPHSVVGHARRMMQRGRDVLTCSEQVSLLPDALRGSGPKPHPEVLYDGALACIVDGYRNRWPHSIHRAGQLLAQLEEQTQQRQAARGQREDLAAAAAAAAAGALQSDGAAAAPGGEGPQSGNVTLERAVCAVLLGEDEAAALLLGLTAGPGGATAPADAQLRSFVMEHAPSGSQDMRPGLRALATRWLEGVALASFRDTAGQPAMPLETSWFNDPRVAMYLQVRCVSRNEQALAAAHFLCNLLPNLVRLVSEVAAKALAVAVLVATRGQRIAAAAAALGSAVAAAAATKRRSPRAPSPTRRDGPQSSSGPGAAAAAAAAARPPPGIGRLAPGVAAAAVDGSEDVGAFGAAAAAVTVGTSSALPLEPPAAMSAAAAAGRGAGGASGPFGHPYGKTLRSTSAAAAAAAAPLPDVGASLLGTPRPVQPVASRAPAAAPPPPPVLAAAAAAAGSAAIAGSSTSPDLRRRFAASAAVDAAVGLPAVDPETLDARAAAAMASHDVDDDEAHAHDGELAEDEAHLLDDEAASASRRGMTEQDLRAHLAGLEAAMWDSEVPVSWASPSRLLMLVVGTAATVAALFMFVLRRQDAGLGAPTRSPPPLPALVSITVSSFAGPN